MSAVWLRKNIIKDTAENAHSEGVDVYDFWTCDEMSFIVQGTPTVDELTADFDSLWAAHESDGLTDAERFEAMSARLDEQDAALMELGDLLGGE